MDDYAYLNARVRARQGRLIGRVRYDALLTLETPTDLVKSLLDSPYARALAYTGVTAADGTRPDATVHLEAALRRDLTRCLAELREIASGRPRILMEVLLLRWDAHNLKTVLRGKRAAAPLEEILAATMPVGVLDEMALAELIRAPTARAVADVLATWRNPFARPLLDGLRLVGDADTLQPIEFELDRFVFAQGVGITANGDENDRTVREYLRALLDQANLLTALRYLEERSALSGGAIAMGHEAARHFLDGAGRFTRHHFLAMVSARDLRRGLSLLAGTPYAWLADTLAERAPVSLPLAERTLARAVLSRARSLARRDPLGIGVAVAYIEQKTNEVRNLRLLLRGKVSGLGAEQITEWMIM